ncbi:MAG: hypothetical protein HY788_13525 [Deltaproteobacteria bacterium]|nr:hypothetical protein [Deltaproteobacteria bacterium]
MVKTCLTVFVGLNLLFAGMPPSESQAALNVSLQIRNPHTYSLTMEPITSGIPLPRRLNVVDSSGLRLLDSTGVPIPAQFTPLARWGGAPTQTSQPIRWVLLDFQASIPASGTTVYSLQQGGPGPSPSASLTVTDGADTVTVNTGAAEFRISKSHGGLSAPGLASPMYGRLKAGSDLSDTLTGPVTVSVVLQGPMRASVHVRGAYRDSTGQALMEYTNRYWFYAGQSKVRLFHTVENNNLCPLGEYEQLTCFDIGSGGSIDLEDLSLVFPASLGTGLTYQAGGQGDPVSGNLVGNVLLYQDSSGTDSWNRYPTMTDWDANPLDTRPRMQSYVSFKGYRITSGGSLVNNGDQAAGWLSVTGSGGSCAIGVRDFWRNFPKALRAAPDGTLELGLFPDEFGGSGYSFNLRAGEHKTHELWLAFGSSGAPAALEPLFALAPAKWYVDSGGFGRTALPNGADWPDHEQYIDYQLDTSPDHDDNWSHYFRNLTDAIEQSDFYGIFDYGDWPIDYEGYEVAPLNCKYDYDLGMWIQWARSGDARWFRLAEAADRHFADIDILHNLHSPRHWGDGIAFGHSEHDEPGFLNPHRNRNSGSTDTAYGVPGMLTAYYLTGYEKALESALELSDCVEYRLRNDSELCSAFPDCSGEGYALMGGLYAAGERLAANSLVIAVAAYRATADSRYLAVADALVDWARSASQPYINGITGEAEEMRPWLLNMYLRALATYLDMRSEFGLPDTYSAGNSFREFADWLHQYPWLPLTSISSGERAAYPYMWWFDGRADNSEPSINNWLLLGADALAYAYLLTETPHYLDWAAQLFRTGIRDPFFEDDALLYTETKQTINSIVYGNVFLNAWQASTGPNPPAGIPDGIWKDGPMPGSSELMNFYVQTYLAGSILVIVSPDGITAYAFLDPDLSNGVDVDDIGSQGHHLTVTFIDESQGTAALSLAGQSVRNFNLYRWFAYAPADVYQGIFKNAPPGDAAAGMSLYTQTYDTAVVAILSSDARAFEVFFDTDKTDGVNVDSISGDSRLECTFPDPEQGSGVLSVGGGTPQTVGFYRWFASPGAVQATGGAAPHSSN